MAAPTGLAMSGKRDRTSYELGKQGARKLVRPEEVAKAPHVLGVRPCKAAAPSGTRCATLTPRTPRRGPGVDGHMAEDGADAGAAGPFGHSAEDGPRKCGSAAQGLPRRPVRLLHGRVGARADHQCVQRHRRCVTGRGGGQGARQGCGNASYARGLTLGGKPVPPAASAGGRVCGHYIRLAAGAAQGLGEWEPLSRAQHAPTLRPPS